ncbi:MAG: flavodoxin family protein [Planctomycetota bacterium]
MDRRGFLTTGLTTGAGVISAGASSARGQSSGKIKIVGISCSPRKGKTTATAIKVALDAAKKIDPHIHVELIDLGGKKIAGWSETVSQAQDDFNEILPKLKDPDLGGLIIGSPSYFRSMSSFCKAFLERLAVLRKPKLLLADVPVGALAVGAYRNGGQELVIEQIQAVMLCHEVMLVGGKPGAHQGATLWNAYKDDIMKDEFGIATAKQLGIRVAQAALRLA